MSKFDSFLLEGNNNQGVLLCHTLSGSPAQMRELGKKLNKKGYTVSCPIYKGHENGDYLELINTTIEDWYNDVENAYNELKKTVERVYVVGMSVGGSLSIKLASDKDVAGVVTINGPVIGFDIEQDVFIFRRNIKDEEKVSLFREHRTIYFDFVTELGQTINLKKITAPFFVIQGSLDKPRYKTSSQLLMRNLNSEVKQRKDYAKSTHILLEGPDKKEAIKDIIKFIEEN